MPEKAKSVWILLDMKGQPFKVSLEEQPKPWVKAKASYRIPNKPGMGRTKGNGHERETAHVFSMWLYKKEGFLRRTPLSGGWSSNKMGDICLDPELQRMGSKNPPLYVECRFYKKLLQHDFFTWVVHDEPKTLTDWVNEVESKCLGRLPFLVLKGNRTEAWVMALERWFPAKGNSVEILWKGAPVLFHNSTLGYGFFIPLLQLEEHLGDGQEFIEGWVRDGGPGIVRGLGGFDACGSREEDRP